MTTNPIEVVRVRTEHGSHIEPPCGDHWSNLRKLQWHAAVAKVDCGLEINVARSSYASRYFGIWIRNIGYYDIYIGDHREFGPLAFLSAWTFINGLIIGANASRESA